MAWNTYDIERVFYLFSLKSGFIELANNASPWQNRGSVQVDDENAGNGGQ
jgi:hypothetical protein